ncbi:MAG: (Fe-S)-binding protein [Pseudomonadota bacterium]
MEELSKPDPIEAALNACVRCGACMQVCPVYRQGRREELVARGKLALLKAAGAGGLAADRHLAELLSRCLLCGRCNANCPNQVPAKEAFRAARARLARTAGPQSLGERLVITQALPHPRRLDLLAKAAGAAWPLLPALSGLRLRLPGLEMASHLPALAQRPFHQDAPQRLAGPAGAPRLGLFVACLANYMQPDLARRALRLLSEVAEVVVLPQACRGLPAVSAGLEDAARQLARANLAHWQAAGVDKLVTFCGSCAYGLARELPRLLAGDPAAHAAQALADSVLDISQVLAERPRRLAGRAIAAAGPVAVHDPCHLKLDLGVWQEPRAMLAAAGVELVEMAGADACCGGGGLFGLHHPELSQGIFAPRREALVDSGAATLATGCSGCYLQWRSGLDPKLKVAHPLELLEPARA